MKKLLLLSIICISSLCLSAQFPFNIGVHGGTTISKLKIDDAKSSYKNGYMFGVFARLNLGPIYVEPALNFSRKESEIKIQDIFKDDLYYNSFDIPVMLGFHVLDLPLMKLRAFLGPVASFPGKLKFDKLDEKVSSESVIWNGKVGIGVDIWKLTLDVDYEKGFNKLRKGGQDDQVKSPSIYNITVGFKII